MVSPIALAVPRLIASTNRRRLLERQLRRIGALQDARGEPRGAIEHLAHVGTVRHQPALAHQEVVLVDRRQLRCGGEVDHPLAVQVVSTSVTIRMRVGRMTRHRRERGVEIVGVAHAERLRPRRPRLRACVSAAL